MSNSPKRHHANPRPRATHFAMAACALMLASCAAPKPPTPPAVDESTRRPANDPRALEQLRLQAEAHNSALRARVQARQREAEALTTGSNQP